jgi:uncharacterized protein
MTLFLTSLFTALGLMLIIEGLLPFIAPDRWKALFKAMLDLPPAQIRMVGLGSIIVGLSLLWLVL